MAPSSTTASLSTMQWSALALLLGMAATVGTALGFEHIGGYIPCMLCLQQRIPYYVGLPIAALAVVAIWLHWPRALPRLLIGIIGLLMLAGLGLAIYHSGVEFGWWPGPASCGVVASPQGSGNGVLDQLNTFIPPSCDSAAWRDPVLNMSFANWNVIASAFWALVAGRALIKD
ncbi:MAG: disulfide bond formation protein B [Mesorhizobium sp.]